MRDIPAGISSEIRAEMGRQNMSFRELADRSGLSYTTVWRKIKTEQRDFLYTDLKDISKALGLKISDLVARAEQSEESGQKAARHDGGESA
ncbi:MAG: helix-turn-helix transcriptional regulator [Actinomycetaceae bacterium]|nr:helix-turn-helix transcriptional regulator [Arcanobacterium sp.]MDD7505583.1 helix-turn-helix transcriptional regulator [Actinomycetaceae bacterium]MDY6143798.1 helix-turn-helix transcriptional regulator [Arcanobacterium sp.]